VPLKLLPCVISQKQVLICTTALSKPWKKLSTFSTRGGGTGNSLLQPLNLSGEEKRALKIFMVEALSGDDINITYPRIP